MRANLNCLDEPVSHATIRSMRERMDLLEEENRQLRAAAKVRARREGAERLRELEMAVARLRGEVAEKTAEVERLCAQYLEDTRRDHDALGTMLRRDWGLSERRASFLVCLFGHEGYVSTETLRIAIVGPAGTISDTALKVLAHHTRRQVDRRGVEVVTRYGAGYSLTEAGRVALKSAVAAFKRRGGA